MIICSSNTPKPTTLDLSSFDTSKVTNMLYVPKLPKPPQVMQEHKLMQRNKFNASSKPKQG